MTDLETVELAARRAAADITHEPSSMCMTVFADELAKAAHGRRKACPRCGATWHQHREPEHA